VTIAFFLIFFVPQDPYASQLPSRFVSVKNNEETHRLIASGKYAIIGKTIDSIFFPEDEILDDDLKVKRRLIL